MSNESKEAKDILKEVMRQELKVKPKLSKKTANSFNLAACCIPVIYNAIYNRRILAATFLVLTAIPQLFSLFATDFVYSFICKIVFILTVLLAIYSGVTGNQKAYDARNYDDEEDFIKSQRFWLPAAIIFLIAHMILLPIQNTKHYNVAQMIKFAQAKKELKLAIEKGAASGDLLGVNTVAENVPAYIAKNLGKGKFDGQNTITMPNGYKYTIEGYLYECGSKASNTYHEQKTSCATVWIDVNGNKGPNQETSYGAVENIKKAFNKQKINDIFTMYIYNDDLAPKKGSIEEHALKGFERK